MSIDTKTPTGMILALVFCSEHVDKTGESLSVKGLSLDTFHEGLGLVNYEHKTSKDGNGEEVVGKVIFAKKIFSKADCDNELQKKAWDDLELPFVWGIVRLFDVAGHSGAKALAASIRDQQANKEKIILRASIEGNTISRDGNKLTECLARRLTLTFSPANATCDTTLISDPGAPDGFKKDLVPKKDFPELEDAIKFENPEYATLYSSNTQLNVIDPTDLNKAIDAGGGCAAPDTLVGGSALAVENIGRKKSVKERVKDVLSKDWGDKFDKSEVRKLIKFVLPEVSDSYIDHFENAIEDLHIKRNSVKKSENSQVNIYQFHNLEITLKKSIDDLKVSSLTDTHMPVVYSLRYKLDGKEYPAGRFMLYDNKLTHLEDYYGMLDRFLPEGPLTVDLVSQIYKLRDGQQTSIKNEPIPLGIDPEQPQVPDVEADKHNGPQTPPASIFDYMRVGMDQPHTLEVNGGNYYLDGNKLSGPEINTIYLNVKNRNASLRYKNTDQLAKAEGEPDHMSPASVLTHLRNAVKAGHIHPDVERAATHHLYVDPRTGHGNKYAYSEFRNEKKPGAHVALDINDFKSVNDAFDHDTGTAALKTFFGHVKSAADEAAPGANKIFTPMGDEGYLHFPTHEHAAKFARGLTQRLEATPPIGGVHKLSTTIGFGNTPEEADKASLIAKEQKYLPGQEHLAPRQKKAKFPLGQTPNLAHSLIPGKEGPIPFHDPTPEAIKQSIPEKITHSELKAA